MTTTYGTDDHLTACKSAASFDPDRLQLHTDAIGLQERHPGTRYTAAIAVVSGEAMLPGETLTAFKAGTLGQIQARLHNDAIGYSREHSGTPYVQSVLMIVFDTLEGHALAEAYQKSHPEVSYEAALTAVQDQVAELTAGDRAKLDASWKKLASDAEAYAKRIPGTPHLDAILAFGASRLKQHEDSLAYVEANPGTSYASALASAASNAGSSDAILTAFKAMANADQGRLQLHQGALDYQGRFPGTSYGDAVAAVSSGKAGPDDFVTACKTMAGVDSARLKLHLDAIALQESHPGTTYQDAVAAVSQHA
jgi:hypothetical protein